MDINTNPSHSRTMNPDMALSSSPGLNETMAPGGRNGPPRSAWLQQQHGSTLPQVMAQTQGIHLALGGNMGHRHQWRLQL